jgi:hypothetical protein
VNGLSSAISGVGDAIGRYFSVVSFIPSLFLVGFTLTLLESGAWDGNGEPDWAKAGNAFTHVGNLALLTLVSIAVGVVVHPIQFALVQFFEGYWGTGRVAQRLRAARMWHYRRRYNVLAYNGPGPWAGIRLQEQKKGELKLKPREQIDLISKRDESARLKRGYPEAPADIMPTRLGNVLRRYERLAGSQYELDAVRVIRHVAFVAPSQHVDYLNDQRQLLDLSVRMCATSIFATLISIAFLWHHGPWLAIALVPYAIAYVSYRGAVVVAHEYGAAISTIIDLDRFALYDYLRMPRPVTTADEQSTNRKLVDLISHKTGVDITYRHPPGTNGADPPAATDSAQEQPAAQRAHGSQTAADAPDEEPTAT